MEKITGIYLCGESASNFNSSRVVVLNSDTPHDFSWLSRPWPSPSRSSFLFPLLAVWALVGASGMIVSSPFLSTYYATDKRSIIGPTSPGETHLEHKKLHQVSQAYPTFRTHIMHRGISRRGSPCISFLNAYYSYICNYAISESLDLNAENIDYESCSSSHSLYM